MRKYTGFAGFGPHFGMFDIKTDFILFDYKKVCFKPIFAFYIQLGFLPVCYEKFPAILYFLPILFTIA